MPKIYLARHGQDEDNALGLLNGQRDKPLTSIGIEQAKVLAQKIKESDLGITKVYSSPLHRAYKTASIVSDALNLPQPEKVELLLERQLGVMSGKPIKDIPKICGEDILRADPITYFLNAEGAETFPELMERAGKFLEWLQENNTEENILIVCHGDIGKMIYANFYKLGWKETLLESHFGNSEVLLLEENIALSDRYIHKTLQHNH